LAFSLSSLDIVSSQSQTGIIDGTVKDPNGAAVVGAKVAVRNEATGETRDTVTDNQGRFKVEGLAPGGYKITINQGGFKTSERAVSIESGKTAAMEIKLEIAETRVEVNVPTKGAITPNSDPNYRALRDGDFAETWEVTNLILKRDVGAITLRSGRVGFLHPVLGRTAVGIFVGDGEFTLTPFIPLEKRYLKLMTESDTVVEPFDRLAFYFTDETWQEIKSAGKESAPDQRMKDTLRDFRSRMRRNTERPRSMVEAFYSGEDVQNIDATILAHLYNPKRAPLFSAYIFGKKHDDLRFYINPYGAIPQLLSPEEVAVVNYDVAGKEEGFWYLSHPESEWKAGAASSNEDKRTIDAEHYRIETVIAGEKLTATCELTFNALLDGERVFKFNLLPTLRATRVVFADKEINYIQEKKDEDSAFFAILPEPLVKGRKYKIYIEYQGDKVVTDEGGGNFAVGARTSWYPSVNAFNDRATFDLTFKVPKKYTLVGVGKQVKESKEADFAVSQWVSDVPLAVAGFNYGVFKKKEINDPDAKYQVEGYATSNLPDYLREVGAEQIGGMSPVRLIDQAIVESQNSIRIYNNWFGEAPYGRIAITQQPQFNFGQSWPTLVYLPIISFFDSTQRWRLFGMNNRITEFIQEVTSHEVAHQWWGHIVGWSSYHDQWLSEGFADFSASLYLQHTEPNLDKYLKFWESHRKRILDKNQFGVRPNDAGPIWMGLRLNTPRAPGAYNQIVYPKGSYVLHMLRWLMWDRKTGDQNFKAMMHDFVKSHFNDNASTESFKAIVEKHMTPDMDLDGNKRMNWFFNQWVYGIEVPRYRFDYTLTPESDGKVTLRGKITQSDVSPNFKMVVPVYLDFGKGVVRLGTIPVMGSMTTDEFTVKLPEKPKRAMINYHYDILASESASAGK
ncbi:MAG TPA: carboxypeptidase regulatory-like domain-containing protein, partial [Blastocatellia bacterium]|nr:carboxypeptidase regulatory-like domain-containing protein [Blastocatellia bacterium]